MAEQEATIEIEEKEVQTQDTRTMTEEEATAGGFTPEEIAMGKSTGVIKPKVEKDKKEDGKAAEEGKEKEDEGKVEEEEGKEKEAGKSKAEPELDEDDPDAEAKKLETFNANEKALYWKQKKERRKRQEAERKAELLEVKLAAATKPQGKKDGDGLEDLDKELEELDKGDDKDVLTKGDLKRIDEEKAQRARAIQEKAQAINESLQDRYDEARSLNPKFDALCDLANEVMKNDKSEGGTFAIKLIKLAEDPEGDIAGFITKLAKFNDKYAEVISGKSDSGKKGEDTKTVNRMVNNAQRRVTSAGVGGGSGRRVVTESDLTVEDCKSMTETQWGKLKPETRKRLLQESCQ